MKSLSFVVGGWNFVTALKKSLTHLVWVKFLASIHELSETNAKECLKMYKTNLSNKMDIY